MAIGLIENGVLVSVATAKINSAIAQIDQANATFQKNSLQEIFQSQILGSDPSITKQIARPVNRPNGGLLQINDRWINPSTGNEGFWNGTVWLTVNSFVSTDSLNPLGGVFGGGTGFTFAVPITPYSSKVFFERVRWYGKVGASHNDTNYFAIRARCFLSNGSADYRNFIASTQDVLASSTFDKTVVENFIFDLQNPAAASVGFDVHAIGNPAPDFSSLTLTNISFSWRYVL